MIISVEGNLYCRYGSRRLVGLYRDSIDDSCRVQVILVLNTRHIDKCLGATLFKLTASGYWIFFTDTLLVQQVDFLETILEETSDDLQSDSDRSGTTYWLGSDSETESVIHIRARQRAGENKQE